MADEQNQTPAVPQAPASAPSPRREGGPSGGGHGGHGGGGGRREGGPGGGGGGRREGGPGGPGGPGGGPGGPRRGKRQFFRKKKVCKFCVEKIDLIDYKRADILSQFVQERGKILPRRMTGVCGGSAWPSSAPATSLCCRLPAAPRAARPRVKSIRRRPRLQRLQLRQR